MNFLNLTKTFYRNHTANITLNVGKLDTFPQRSDIGQRSSLTSLLFNITVDVLVNSVRQEKEIKGIQTRKEVIKLPLSTDDVIIYVEHLKESAKKKKSP